MRRNERDEADGDGPDDATRNGGRTCSKSRSPLARSRSVLLTKRETANVDERGEERGRHTKSKVGIPRSRFIPSKFTTVTCPFCSPGRSWSYRGMGRSRRRRQASFARSRYIASMSGRGGDGGEGRGWMAAARWVPRQWQAHTRASYAWLRFRNRPRTHLL